MSPKKKDDKEPSPQGKLIGRIPFGPADLTKFDEFLEHEKRILTQFQGEEPSEEAVLLFAAQELLNFMLDPLQRLEQEALDKTGFEVRPPLTLDVRHIKECLRRLEHELKRPKLRSLDDIVELLKGKITKRTLRSYIQQGKLKVTKIGRTYWIKDSDFDEFVEKHIGPQKRRSAKKNSEVERK